jgi:hypothetical protein
VCAASVEESRQPVKIQGRRLHHMLRGMPAANRAIVAFAAMSGEVTIDRLSRAQAARLLKVAAGYVATVSRISDVDREYLKRNPFLLAAWHNHRPLTDADVDHLLGRIGLERALAAIDRLTAPTALVHPAAE